MQYISFGRDRDAVYIFSQHEIKEFIHLHSTLNSISTLFSLIHQLQRVIIATERDENILHDAGAR